MRRVMSEMPSTLVALVGTTFARNVSVHRCDERALLGMRTCTFMSIAVVFSSTLSRLKLPPRSQQAAALLVAQQGEVVLALGQMRRRAVRHRSSRSRIESRSNKNSSVTRARGGGAGTSCPKCQGHRVERFTSNSEKNPGREFWKCSDSKCRAFIGWVDDSKENSRNGGSGASSRRRTGSGPSSPSRTSRRFGRG